MEYTTSQIRCRTCVSYSSDQQAPSGWSCDNGHHWYTPCRLLAVGSQSMRLTRHVPGWPFLPANCTRAVTPWLLTMFSGGASTEREMPSH